MSVTVASAAQASGGPNWLIASSRRELPISPRRVIAGTKCRSSVAGAAIVIFFSLRHGGLGSLGAGDLWLLAAVVSAAIAYTLSGKLSRTMPGWEVISWVLVIALVVFVISLLLVVWLAVTRRYQENALMIFVPYGPYFIISTSLILFFPDLLVRLVPG